MPNMYAQQEARGVPEGKGGAHLTCPHPFKSIVGYNEKSRAIEWVCSICKVPGTTDWEAAHHWERAEALMKFYENESSEMMPREG
jgi:hypothetical protein